MSPTNVEICSNCGRLLLHSEQAYVVRGKISCAECNRVLRNEQVPKPAPSSEPFPETKKNTKKDASLRNRILVAISVSIVVAAIVIIAMCFSGPKYQVEETIDNDSVPIGLRVLLIGPPANLKVLLIGNDGSHVERIVKKIIMQENGRAITVLPFAELSEKAVPWSLSFSFTPSGELIDKPTLQSYILVVALCEEGKREEKVVFRKTISVIGQKGIVSIANPE